MNDFRQLSPIDFEHLVRDLLQAELNQRVESFGPGRDGGIDFRFATSAGTTIIQAKHYAGSSLSNLLQAAKKENAKVAKLNPVRYILATSLSLTPISKARIIAALPDAPLQSHDIFGQEDLDNLIGLHPGVFRRHFKLWLTDTETLDRIVHSGVYNRTEAELEVIKTLVPRFVHNPSVDRAETILAERGALIISGEPGVGKTTLARAITWLHLEQGWRVFVVDDFKEAMEVCSTGDKRLIVFDDFLGQINLTNDAIREVDQRLPIFLERVRSNKELRFILTTRDYLLNQAQLQSGKLSSERVSSAELILNVGSYTRSIRAQIVFNHIYFSDLTTEEKHALLSDNFYLKMIDHRNFSPRLIDLLTRSDYLTLQSQPITDVISSVLDRPSILWETPYRSHLSEDSRILMRALFFCGYSPSMDSLIAAFTRILTFEDKTLVKSQSIFRFRRALKPLEGSIVSIANGRVHFTNPGIRDFLTGVIIEDGLLSTTVQTAATVDELSRAIDFYVQNDKQLLRHMDSPYAWSEALLRVVSRAKGAPIRKIRLSLELAGIVADKRIALKAAEALMTQIDQDGIEYDDEQACRHALEIIDAFSEEELVLLPSRSALSRALADVLASSSEAFALDEILTIAEALELYGGDFELANDSRQAALQSVLDNLDSRLAEFSDSSEVSAFQSEIMAASKNYGLSVTSSHERRMVDRIEYLEMREDRRENEEYLHSSRSSANFDASDSQIHSMFSSLLTPT